MDNIGAFDFETHNWTEVVCCGLRWKFKGVYGEHFICDTPEAWGEKTEWVAEEALRCMSVMPEVKYWYAHNMGKFDGLFMQAAAHRLGWQMSAIIAGSNRVLEWTFKAPNGCTVILRDSYALIDSSLAKAAVSFELPSRKFFQRSDYKVSPRNWGLEKLRNGCMVDCQLVLELLDKAETLVESWGGKVRLTFSSTALSIIRADLKARGKTLPDLRNKTELNSTARRAYYGSRVEVIDHLPEYTLVEADRNSSYPAAMCGVLPCEPVAAMLGEDAAKCYSQGHEGVYYATVSIPADTYIPCLPFRLPCNKCLAKSQGACEHKTSGAIYFPTGQWSAWFPANELRYAQSQGVTVEILSGVIYTREDAFTEFIKRVYAHKAQATGAAREFDKKVLNGAYGKFGQKPEQCSLVTFRNKEEQALYAMENPGEFSPLSADSLAGTINSYRWPAQTNYAVAAYITAGARIALHQALISSASPAYCDTDSVHCLVGGFPARLVGAELGQWKIEIKECTAKYYAPKIYRIEELAPEELAPKDFAYGEPSPTDTNHHNANQKVKSGKVHYASKGFPIKCDACLYDEKDKPCTCDENFMRVVNGELTEAGRMQLSKSQLKCNQGEVKRVIDAKFWRGFSAKRKPNPDGSTVPWSVLELMRGDNRQAQSPARRNVQTGFSW